MATTRALEDAEIFAIFAAIGERHATRNRAMLWVGIHMALRASELCGLTVSDVWDGNSSRTYITIRAEIAKGNRDRTIRIGDEVKAVIDEFIAWKMKNGEPVEPSAPLFVSQKGGHVSRITLFNIVKRLMVLAGIDQSPHCLRKTGATLYYETSGYDLIATQQFLGHSDPSVTRKYIGITPVQREEYAQRASLALALAIEGKRNSPGDMFRFSKKAANNAEFERVGAEVQALKETNAKLTETNARLTRQNGALLDLLASAGVELPQAVNSGKVIPIDLARRRRKR